jgi:hypothetical protein
MVGNMNVLRIENTIFNIDNIAYIELTDTSIRISLVNGKYTEIKIYNYEDSGVNKVKTTQYFNDLSKELGLSR